MAVIDHGFWVRYIPATPPEGIPRTAAFCRRESDGFDWYEYVNVEENHPAHHGRKKQFKAATVKCVVETAETPNSRADESEAVIRTAAVDETRLFPQDCQLVELEEVEREQDEAALIEEFVNRRINLATGKLGERWIPPPPPDPLGDLLKQILNRLEKLEGGG